MTPPEPVEAQDLVSALREAWGIPADTPKAAPETDEQREARIRKLVQDQRMAIWQERCPPEFRKAIDRTKVANLPAWDQADKWQGGFPGLWLWSHSTGHAKSRMLWRKYGQLHVRQGKTVIYTTGKLLGDDYKDFYFTSKTGSFYKNYTRTGVVMLDDLDKLDLRETNNGADMGRMLRELFNHFYESHTPVIATANEPIAFFEATLGPSCARRMREVCREIEF